jgi:hypothetical protein
VRRTGRSLPGLTAQTRDCPACSAEGRLRFTTLAPFRLTSSARLQTLAAHLALKFTAVPQAPDWRIQAHLDD